MYDFGTQYAFLTVYPAASISVVARRQPLATKPWPKPDESKRTGPAYAGPASFIDATASAMPPQLRSYRQRNAAIVAARSRITRSLLLVRLVPIVPPLNV